MGFHFKAKTAPYRQHQTTTITPEFFCSNCQFGNDFKELLRSFDRRKLHFNVSKRAHCDGEVFKTALQLVLLNDLNMNELLHDDMNKAINGNHALVFIYYYC